MSLRFDPLNIGVIASLTPTLSVGASIDNRAESVFERDRA